MSRRRSTNPTKAISITLPETLLRRLDNYLAYESSRSAYIAKALERKLDQQKGFDDRDLETEALVRYLLTREIPSDLKASLRTYWSILTSSNRDEGL
jgi:metal-responsive CopG/Arc/MetJ family transcriptional regulator